MELVLFRFAAKHGVVDFPCYDPGMYQEDCKLPVLLVAEVRLCVDHYGFFSLVGLSIRLLPTWHIDAQQKLTCLPRVRFFSGLPTALRKVKCMPC